MLLLCAVAFSPSLLILCVLVAHLCLEVDCLGELIELKAGDFLNQDQFFSSMLSCTTVSCEEIKVLGKAIINHFSGSPHMPSK